ncbi:efflux RND transporter periplasmic adaptor subunit [Allorhodopirellula solitaria]|uniref:HlyD family secretion protein n=1 Tax=Allorhodopirellula solitaria TaxID=2527987 RepID=A0A5C5XW58_9BACT|nr:HlyD family efflux transporter periplasmic adaptor subunit [Allorhodopirellula solitaria]TWT67556.1 HlyD family secretion protein [Allorhodopirellula solitaria]
MSRPLKALQLLIGSAVVVGGIAAIWYLRDRVFSIDEVSADRAADTTSSPDEKQTILEISSQARKNLGLVSKPVRKQDYWRSVLIPGEIADRPGLSDRGITSPAVGVVTEIHAFPGDTLRPGKSLFTLRLFSEYLQSTQTQLYKATQETEIIQAEIERISQLASVGAVSKSRMINLRSDISRQSTLIQSAKQELLTRGLSPDQVAQIESGTFISTVEVVAPPVREMNVSGERTVPQANSPEDVASTSEIAYEVQELSVELGQQVQAGQLLAKLSNHHSLYVIGHAFKREAPFLEKAAQERRPVDIEFAEDSEGHWPEFDQKFEIRHLSNSIDTESRTFDFFIPLANQSRVYGTQGESFLVWRFRPGQRTRLHVPVEKYEDVFVVPASAVVREGPEAYVFRQNGDLFKQIAVHVLYEDRQSVVIADDGSIQPGTYLAQSAAASLNRVLKAQTASGEQPGVHVHPDGTVHAAH